MATITTGSFAKALWPGVNSWYGKSYNEHTVEWSNLFDSFNSSKNYEEDMGITSFGLVLLNQKVVQYLMMKSVKAFSQDTLTSCTLTVLL